MRNFSSEPAKDVELRLEVDGQLVAKGFVDLAADGTAQKTLAWKFEKGGMATITGRLENDSLPDDDVKSLVLEVPKELRALLVDGSPSPQKYKDEAFFTEAALSSPGSR